MRLLLQRDDHPGRRTPVENTAADRNTNSNRNERPSMPLRELPARHQGDPPRSGGGAMISSKPALSSLFPRREFLKAGGALVVGFSMRSLLNGDSLSAQAVAVTRGGIAGPPDPKQIDTWLAVHADNTATVYVGYVELGQG